MLLCKCLNSAQQRARLAKCTPKSLQTRGGGGILIIYDNICVCFVAACSEAVVGSRQTAHIPWCSSRSCLPTLRQMPHSHGRQKVRILPCSGVLASAGARPWGGRQVPPPKFWAFEKLSKKFLLGKCSSKNAKFGLRNPCLGNFEAKL